ncbi:MAG: N-acetylmuramoyl-L-alanine amidase [Paracoccus sp. (in: a-proteobacteria)]|uniref:peptidoglycan recognition protein family protein n=1 Tax=Paracoccus sp. TaxID=267 RepID=UPI0026DEF6A1|nr:N-acetylmuramoyl-L-alanine amidase [Paracoccus sp. (in: a-proteobacteria)]MDO5621900.1 N-acetylmuramoyl-L-alanine amidase [Paracoccus sp. (in: a-proteobacteria)]
MTGKMTAIRARQARCAALGFWPGPIDGLDGPRTRAAFAAVQASQQARGRPFAHPSGITRVHWHWTAGSHNPANLTMLPYHAVIFGDGTVRWLAAPAALRSHTLNANGGAIGLALCGMAGARERPFAWGSAPITPAQVSALARETARLCREYDVPVSRWSTLSHAEVQPSLAVRQRQKWDISVLPGMAGPGDPVSVGDRLRVMVAAEINANQ